MSWSSEQPPTRSFQVRCTLNSRHLSSISNLLFSSLLFFGCCVVVVFFFNVHFGPIILFFDPKDEKSTTRKMRNKLPVVGFIRSSTILDCLGVVTVTSLKLSTSIEFFF